MKIFKFQKRQIKEFFEGLPKKLALRAFLTFLILLLLFSILGGFIFYKYAFLAKKKEVEISEKPLQFKEKTYQTILEIWQEKEKNFQKIEQKEYKNPFKRLTE